ncbi:MAG TPA: hypothetical protein VFE45_02325, partial [Coriobacteriia bacterium]|nr:hypothetical protein [Coriobacteriia bacterium]
PIEVGLAASAARGSGLLHATAEHIVTRYPGETVEVAARDAQLVDLYARTWGLREVTPGRGRMIGTVSERDTTGRAPSAEASG